MILMNLVKQDFLKNLIKQIMPKKLGNHYQLWIKLDYLDFGLFFQL
jgi:hypothetical protein